MQYFSGQLKRGFTVLYTGRVLMQIASGLLSIFIPIFLYTLFEERMQLVVLFFISASLLYALFVALGARYMNRFGFRRALAIGTLFGAAFFTALLFAESGNIFIFVVLAIVTLTLFRIFFWIPYHVDFAIFSDKSNRGREVGVLFATFSFLGVVGPLAAGFIIHESGFNVFFFLLFCYMLLLRLFFCECHLYMNDLHGVIGKHGNTFSQLNTELPCSHYLQTARRMLSQSSCGQFLSLNFLRETTSRSVCSLR